VQAQKGKQGETPMALSILNNISSLTAENALSNTQANLQKTLTQLSTGLKINSGSDDAAGLSIAEGMTANMAALTQSQQNASNGIGMLQTADGALSQVTTLLNRAVTLATEAGNSNITGSQASALDTEFQSIMSEINQIGKATNFNSQNVFQGNTGTVLGTTAGTKATPILATNLVANGSVTTIVNNTVLDTNGNPTTFTYTATNATTKISDILAAAVTADATAFAGLGAAAGTGNQGNTTGTIDANNIAIKDTAGDSLTITSSDPTLSGLVAQGNAGSNNTIFISDGSTANSASTTQIATVIQALSATTLGLAANNLTSQTNAQAALTSVTSAINVVSAQRGVIGAAVNRLTAASGDMSSEVTNLQSAANSIQNADIGKTVANMTQYNVLQSTGMAALQQSNQAQQAVLKLVQ
jgi:flagellin